MKKFKFKLQKLLDLREIQERNVEMELAALVSKQNVERIKQQDLGEKITVQKSVMREKMITGKASISDSIGHEAYVDAARRAIEASEEKARAMEPEISEVRERLVLASQAKKVVEKLKERQREEYDYEWNRQEAKEIDDMNQNIFVRKRAELLGGKHA